MIREYVARRGGYKTTFGHRRYQARRRATLRDQKLCITSASHGAATHGVRCEACANVHKKSA